MNLNLQNAQIKKCNDFVNTAANLNCCGAHNLFNCSRIAYVAFAIVISVSSKKSNDIVITQKVFENKYTYTFH